MDAHNRVRIDRIGQALATFERGALLRSSAFDRRMGARVQAEQPVSGCIKHGLSPWPHYCGRQRAFSGCLGRGSGFGEAP